MHGNAAFNPFYCTECCTEIIFRLDLAVVASLGATRHIKPGQRAAGGTFCHLSFPSRFPCRISLAPAPRRNTIVAMTKHLTTALLVAGLSFASASAEDKANDLRLYELRTYHAETGKLEALLARFRGHTTRLFVKHGMTNIGYWVPVENKDNVLIYLLAYPDRAARDASWKNFMADEDWKKAAAASEKDGRLVSKADQLFLTATDFSPGFTAVGATGERLFEMRTYTTPAGKLPALHSRFRDHTLGLFSKHGITNLGYYQPVAGQPPAGETLLYFLAHKDAAAAQKSWDTFRADPIWVALKKASEDAAGGSLTVPDGVKSSFLKPTDFSPVK